MSQRCTTVLTVEAKLTSSLLTFARDAIADIFTDRSAWVIMNFQSQKQIHLKTQSFTEPQANGTYYLHTRHVNQIRSKYLFKKKIIQTNERDHTTGMMPPAMMFCWDFN